MDLHCEVCGTADYFACAPGTAAEARVQGNVCIIHPAPEIPPRVWCLAHAPRGGAVERAAP